MPKFYNELNNYYKKGDVTMKRDKAKLIDNAKNLVAIIIAEANGYTAQDDDTEERRKEIASVVLEARKGLDKVKTASDLFKGREAVAEFEAHVKRSENAYKQAVRRAATKRV